MATLDEVIAKIKAKKEEEDLTPEEKELLAFAAERKPEETDPDFPKSWAEVFNHKRFKDLNKKATDAEADLARLKREKEQADEEALKKQGEWQKLAETRGKQLDELKQKADKVDAYESTLQETLKSQLSELPEQLRVLVPDEMSTQQKLAWLSKNKAVLTKPKAFEIGAGKRGGESGKEPGKKLNADQQAVARSYGMTDDEYAKFVEEGEEEPESNT